ncbi:MAG: hypothetical protein C5B51_01610 [Terriglobia bacterium]|nr:MAG: hypothetical protein C5B51_01610 [Terriglobia bacterium]
MTAPFLEWLKAIGPLVLGGAVFFAAWWFQRWQVSLAKQKLRHDLYERRFAIYTAFCDLLVALPEKNDEEIKAVCRRADIARLQAPFLLYQEPELEAYLERICEQVKSEVISNIMFIDSIRGHAGMMSDPDVNRDFVQRVGLLGAAKLDLPNRHLPQLSRHFAKLLRLTDFSK